MTDKPKRTRNTNAPLSLGAAFERIDAIERSQSDRIRGAIEAVKAADAGKIEAVIGRVDVKDHAALSAILKAARDERTKATQRDAEPDSPDDSIHDSEPLPRGASDYTPGPAAEAARGRR